jgi:hypothetical protein
MWTVKKDLTRSVEPTQCYSVAVKWIFNHKINKYTCYVFTTYKYLLRISFSREITVGFTILQAKKDLRVSKGIALLCF